MAFALHINMERCTGCNNCVVACPVDALELHTEDPVTTEKIYKDVYKRQLERVPHKVLQSAPVS